MDADPCFVRPEVLAFQKTNVVGGDHGAVQQ